MKPLITTLFILFSFLIFSQNTVEVSISKISSFSTYQKDSIHTMLKNTDLLPYNDIYTPINLKFIINKKTKKVHRYKNDLLIDIVPITKIDFKDSIYTITVVEKREEGWSHYVNQMIDCYLVLDTRKNPINKKQPTFVYWWNWDIYLNDQYTDWCNGNVSDYVTIK